MFDILLLCIVAAGWAHWLASLYCVRTRLRRPAESNSADVPPVSILKPLKGMDADLYENLAGFCRQDCPNFELLFGTRDADDPAWEAVRRLQREFPHVPIRTFVCPDLGLNPKSAILHELSRRAHHNVLVISDSDIRVGPDYLRRVVAPLRDPSVGMVTCLYRSRWTGSLGAILGALNVDLSFLPSAAVGSFLPWVRYAFGATIAVRRDELIAAGGYASIADHLADDYQVCVKLREIGLGVRLSDYVVSHIVRDDSFAAFRGRRVRWARTIRASAPLSYLGVPLTLCTPCSIALVAATGAAPWAWLVLLGSLLLRQGVAWEVCGLIDNRGLRRQLLWLPISDCLDAVIWFAGLFGSRVMWRGTPYRLDAGGRLCQPADRRRLTPGTVAPPPSRFNLPRRLIRRLDAHLRRDSGIFEYSDDPECVFRAMILPAPAATELADGTRVEAGERVIDLHFWNEHMPRVRRGAMISWSHDISRRVARSLSLLHAWLESREDLHDIRAIRARTSFAPRTETQLRRLIERFGFEFHGAVPTRGLADGLHRAGENLLVWGLIWTYNSAASLRTLVGRPRYDLWMSRRALRARYGRRSLARTGPRTVAERPWPRPLEAAPADAISLGRERG